MISMSRFAWQVDREEFRHAIASCMELPDDVDDDDLDAVFDEFDHDSSGRISYAEFHRALR